MENIGVGMFIGVLVIQSTLSLVFLAIGVILGLRLQSKKIEEDIKRLKPVRKEEVGAVVSFSPEELKKRENPKEWEEEQEFTKQLDNLFGVKR